MPVAAESCTWQRLHLVSDAMQCGGRRLLLVSNMGGPCTTAAVETRVGGERRVRLARADVCSSFAAERQSILVCEPSLVTLKEILLRER